MPTPSEIFSLRMELSAAGIPWRACYSNGERIPFPTVSESGIRSLIIDYPEATQTGILADRGVVLVSSLDEARAALIPAETPIDTGIKSEVTGPGAPEPSFGPHEVQKAHGSPRNGPGRAAVEFLEDYLSSGPQASTGIIKAAQAKGISLITLRRAKRPAGVLVEPVRGDGQRVDGWVWRLAR